MPPKIAKPRTVTPSAPRRDLLTPTERAAVERRRLVQSALGGSESLLAIIDRLAPPPVKL